MGTIYCVLIQTTDNNIINRLTTIETIKKGNDLIGPED